MNIMRGQAPELISRGNLSEVKQMELSKDIITQEIDKLRSQNLSEGEIAKKIRNNPKIAGVLFAGAAAFWTYFPIVVPKR